MPMTLLYLHGLNSSSRSHKAGVLTRALAPTPVLAPDYPAHRPEQAVAVLSACFEDLAAAGTIPAVVGSSMGGFYGQYLARRFPVAHLFLVNPALTPWELLADYAGVPMTTAAGETYVLTPAEIAATRAYAIADPCDGVPTTVLVDAGDEVIDHRIAVDLYRNCGRVLTFAGGDHGFQHLDEAVAVIRATLGLA